MTKVVSVDCSCQVLDGLCTLMKVLPNRVNELRMLVRLMLQKLANFRRSVNLAPDSYSCSGHTSPLGHTQQCTKTTLTPDKQTSDAAMPLEAS